jgi:hypothetical protein
MSFISSMYSVVRTIEAVVFVASVAVDAGRFLVTSAGQVVTARRKRRRMAAQQARYDAMAAEDPDDVLAFAQQALTLYSEYRRPAVWDHADDNHVSGCQRLIANAQREIEHRRKLTACMGAHPRLGRNSPLYNLPPEILQQIVSW